MRKLIAIGACVLVLIGVVLWRTGVFGTGKNDPEATAKLLMDLPETLTTAGTAAVTFSVEIKPQTRPSPNARMAGSGIVGFGANNASDITYSSIESSTAANDSIPPAQAHELRKDKQTWYRSPQLVPSDRRPWIDLSRTTPVWGGALAGPGLGIADVRTWLGYLDGIQQKYATFYQTEDLTDLPGAPHEFRITCTAEIASCPPPFGNALDFYFNSLGLGHMDLWLDDSGRPHRMVANFSAAKDRDLPGAENPSFSDDFEEYFMKVTFDLDKFGTALTVTPPADTEITTTKTVVAKGLN